MRQTLLIASLVIYTSIIFMAGASASGPINAYLRGINSNGHWSAIKIHTDGTLKVVSQ